MEVKDYRVYLSGMAKSIKDKLFFEGLVENVNVVIDFGCADGQLLKQIQEDFPNWHLFGVDASREMISKAMENCKGAQYILSNRIPVDMVKSISSGAVFNLSSVIHEIYSYLSPHEVMRFWNDLFSCEAKYIAIRDLMLSESSFRDADINDVVRVKERSDEALLRDFCDTWGSINDQSRLLHYLMKYRYRENWGREVKENYFPITVEQLLSLIPTDRYRIVYFNHYILPHTRNKVLEDFGIELKDNTHVKILLERK